MVAGGWERDERWGEEEEEEGKGEKNEYRLQADDILMKGREEAADGSEVSRAGGGIMGLGRDWW